MAQVEDYLQVRGPEFKHSTPTKKKKKQMRILEEKMAGAQTQFSKQSG